MSFPIVVDCEPGHGGKAMPHLHFGLTGVAVKALVDNWGGRDYRYFERLGEDDATCIVRHDLPSGLWELVFYDRAQGPAR